MTNYIYEKLPTHALAGDINWAGTAASAMLLTNAYAFAAGHEFVSDVVAHEAAGTGYVRQPVASRVVGLTYPYGDGITGQTELNCSDITFPGVQIADWRWLAIYQVGASDATSLLIAVFDWTAQSMSAVDTLTFHFPDGVAAFLGQ